MNNYLQPSPTASGHPSPASCGRGKGEAGFTLIELIMTIVIMGLIVVASANSYKNLITHSFQKTDLIKAVNLARLESSVVNSISYADASLASGYNTLTSNYLSSGYDVRRQVSYQYGNDATTQSLKKITITVYKTGSATAILTSVSYREKNVNW